MPEPQNAREHLFHILDVWNRALPFHAHVLKTQEPEIESLPHISSAIRRELSKIRGLDIRVGQKQALGGNTPIALAHRTRFEGTELPSAKWGYSRHNRHF
jgi:hypothetical protein